VITRRHVRAQVIVWVAVLLPTLFLPILGISIDAGYLFNARRDLQNVADGAARVGAQQIDDRALRRNGDVKLDHDKAIKAANDYARSAQPKVNISPPDPLVSADGSRIDVMVTRTVHPTFLRILKVEDVTISASSRARPCAGIVDSNCP